MGSAFGPIVIRQGLRLIVFGGSGRRVLGGSGGRMEVWFFGN